MCFIRRRGCSRAIAEDPETGNAFYDGKDADYDQVTHYGVLLGLDGGEIMQVSRGRDAGVVGGEEGNGSVVNGGQAPVEREEDAMDIG